MRKKMVQILKFVYAMILFISIVFLIRTQLSDIYEECETDDYCPKYRDLLYVFKCIDKRCELVEAHA